MANLEEAKNNSVDENSRPTEQTMPSLEEEESVIKKKYHGIVPKKPPLISNDHERAYFDSADWALEKQGELPEEKTKPSAEVLPPKLQPTPHQPLPARRALYESSEGEGATDVNEETE